MTDHTRVIISSVSGDVRRQFASVWEKHSASTDLETIAVCHAEDGRPLLAGIARFAPSENVEGNQEPKRLDEKGFDEEGATSASIITTGIDDSERLLRILQALNDNLGGKDRLLKKDIDAIVNGDASGQCALVSVEGTLGSQEVLVIFDPRKAVVYFCEIKTPVSAHLDEKKDNNHPFCFVAIDHLPDDIHCHAVDFIRQVCIRRNFPSAKTVPLVAQKPSKDFSPDVDVNRYVQSKRLMLFTADGNFIAQGDKPVFARSVTMSGFSPQFHVNGDTWEGEENQRAHTLHSALSRDISISRLDCIDEFLELSSKETIMPLRWKRHDLVYVPAIFLSEKKEARPSEATVTECIRIIRGKRNLAYYTSLYSAAPYLLYGILGLSRCRDTMQNLHPTECERYDLILSRVKDASVSVKEDHSDSVLCHKKDENSRLQSAAVRLSHCSKEDEFDRILNYVSYHNDLAIFSIDGKTSGAIILNDNVDAPALDHLCEIDLSGEEKSTKSRVNIRSILSLSLALSYRGLMEYRHALRSLTIDKDMDKQEGDDALLVYHNNRLYAFPITTAPDGSERIEVDFLFYKKWHRRSICPQESYFDVLSRETHGLIDFLKTIPGIQLSAFSRYASTLFPVLSKRNSVGLNSCLLSFIEDIHDAGLLVSVKLSEEGYIASDHVSAHGLIPIDMYNRDTKTIQTDNVESAFHNLPPITVRGYFFFLANYQKLSKRPINEEQPADDDTFYTLRFAKNPADSKTLSAIQITPGSKESFYLHTHFDITLAFLRAIVEDLQDSFPQDFVQFVLDPQSKAAGDFYNSKIFAINATKTDELNRLTYINRSIFFFFVKRCKHAYVKAVLFSLLHQSLDSSVLPNLPRLSFAGEASADDKHDNDIAPARNIIAMLQTRYALSKTRATADWDNPKNTHLLCEDSVTYEMELGEGATYEADLCKNVSYEDFTQADNIPRFPPILARFLYRSSRYTRAYKESWDAGVSATIESHRAIQSLACNACGASALNYEDHKAATLLQLVACNFTAIRFNHDGLYLFPFMSDAQVSLHNQVYKNGSLIKFGAPYGIAKKANPIIHGVANLGPTAVTQPERYESITDVAILMAHLAFTAKIRLVFNGRFADQAAKATHHSIMEDFGLSDENITFSDRHGDTHLLLTSPDKTSVILLPAALIDGNLYNAASFATPEVLSLCPSIAVDGELEGRIEKKIHFSDEVVRKAYRPEAIRSAFYTSHTYDSDDFHSSSNHNHNRLLHQQSVSALSTRLSLLDGFLQDSLVYIGRSDVFLQKCFRCPDPNEHGSAVILKKVRRILSEGKGRVFAFAPACILMSGIDAPLDLMPSERRSSLLRHCSRSRYHLKNNDPDKENKNGRITSYFVRNAHCMASTHVMLFGWMNANALASGRDGSGRPQSLSASGSLPSYILQSQAIRSNITMAAIPCSFAYSFTGSMPIMGLFPTYINHDMPIQGAIVPKGMVVTNGDHVGIKRGNYYIALNAVEQGDGSAVKHISDALALCSTFVNDANKTFWNLDNKRIGLNHPRLDVFAQIFGTLHQHDRLVGGRAMLNPMLPSETLFPQPQVNPRSSESARNNDVFKVFQGSLPDISPFLNAMQFGSYGHWVDYDLSYFLSGYGDVYYSNKILKRCKKPTEIVAESIISPDYNVQVLDASVFSGVTKPAAKGSEGDSYADSLREWMFLKEPLGQSMVPEEMTTQSILDDMNAHFPYMKNVNYYVARAIALKKRYGTPIDFGSFILIGAPGVGKTHYAKYLASLFNTSPYLFSAGGSHNNDIMQVTGSSRGYKDARPGLWAFAMKDTQTANPIVVIDEIDKANPSISNALLSYTEKSTASAYRDKYFEASANISHLSYIFTANTIHDVCPVLKSRMRVFSVPEPTEQEFAAILDNVILGVLSENTIPASEYDRVGRKLLGEGIDDITEFYARNITNRSIRSAKRYILAKIMRIVAPEVVFDEYATQHGMGKC